MQFKHKRVTIRLTPTQAERIGLLKRAFHHKTLTSTFNLVLSDAFKKYELAMTARKEYEAAGDLSDAIGRQTKTGRPRHIAESRKQTGRVHS